MSPALHVDPGRVDPEVEALRRRVAELEEECHRLSVAVNNTDDAILFSDSSALPVFFNVAYAEEMKALLGIDMCPGLQPHTLLPPEERALWDGFHRRVLGGESFMAEFEFEAPWGERLVFETAYKPIVVDGEVTGFTEMTRNISKRKAAEREVARLNAELEERVELRTTELRAANRELEAFAYSVSHDLRAPLRAVDGFAQLLCDEHASQLDAAGIEHLQRIRTGVQRMARLIDHLLRLARLQRRDIRRRPVDLSAMVRAVADELSFGAPPNPGTLVVADGLIAQSDPVLTRVVIENLLGNAVKFTRGRDDARIEFGVLTTAVGTDYFVSDNGVGFDMAHADQLFGIFKRLHRQEDYPGDGIGLATVSRVLSRLGGSVRAEGRPGQGATFWFSLGPS